MADKGKKKSFKKKKKVCFKGSITIAVKKPKKKDTDLKGDDCCLFD